MDKQTRHLNKMREVPTRGMANRQLQGDLPSMLWHTARRHSPRPAGLHAKVGAIDIADTPDGIRYVRGRWLLPDHVSAFRRPSSLAYSNKGVLYFTPIAQDVAVGLSEAEDATMTRDLKQADRLCRLFCNVVDDIITTRALKSAVGEDLSRAQFEGLQYVFLHPHCCIKDLAGGLDVSHPAAVKLVERLEAKKLIARSSYERDRRVVQLEVTSQGGDRARRARLARAKAIEDVLSKTGDGCAKSLMECLHNFIKCALSDERDTNGVCLRCGDRHVDECPVCQAEQVLTGHARTDN